MKKSTGIRFGVGAVSLALLLTACGGGSDSASGEGSKGGTLYILTEAEQILHLDPQRNYTGEDLAFASAYLNRTLTQYTLSKDNAEASQLVADAATDTGTTPDGGLTWEFTLIAPFRYTALLYALILGYLIWGEIPDSWTWVGIGLLVGAGLSLIWSNRR